MANEVIMNVKNNKEEKPVYLAISGYIPVVGLEYRCAKIVHDIPGRVMDAVYIDQLERVEHVQDGIYKFETEDGIYYVSVADVIKSERTRTTKTIYLAKAGRNPLEVGKEHHCAKIIHNSSGRSLEAVCIDCVESIEHVGGQVYRVEATDGVYYISTKPDNV